MHRFFAKKKTDELAQSSWPLPSTDSCATPRTLAASPPSPTKTDRRQKAAAVVEDRPPSITHVLPPSDDFRISMLMPNLSARFTILREHDHYTTHPVPDLPPRSPTRPLGSSLAYATAASDAAPETGAIMERGRTHNTNALFGARQKVYRIPLTALDTSNAVALPGRPIYDDDIRTSTFQQAKDRRRKLDSEQLSAARLPSSNSVATTSTGSSRPPTSDSSSSFYSTKDRRLSLSALSRDQERISSQRSAALDALNFLQPTKTIEKHTPQISPTKHTRASRSFADLGVLKLWTDDHKPAPPPKTQPSPTKSVRSERSTSEQKQEQKEEPPLSARERRRRRVDEHVAKTLRKVNDDTYHERRQSDLSGSDSPSSTGSEWERGVTPQEQLATSRNSAPPGQPYVTLAGNPHSAASQEKFEFASNQDIEQNALRIIQARAPRLRLSRSMHNLAPPLSEHPALRSQSSMPATQAVPYQASDASTTHASASGMHDRAELGGLVKAHLRNTSDLMLTNSSTSTTSLAGQTGTTGLPAATMPVERAVTSHVRQTSVQRRHSTSSIMSRISIPTEANPTNLTNHSPRRHARAPSTETQQERDAFSDELAQRQRAIQQNLKIRVEKGMRSPSPSGARNVFDQSFRSLLHSKSNHDLRSDAAQKTATKKFGPAGNSKPIVVSRGPSARPSMDASARSMSREAAPAPASMGRTLHSRMPRP